MSNATSFLSMNLKKVYGHIERVYRMYTLSNLAASGLKVGVLMYWRNRVDMRLRRPSRLDSLTPRISRSASRSINSIISWVSLQSCS